MTLGLALPDRKECARQARGGSAAERGMSLVEVTIILLVLMLVTSVLAPSIYDYIVDARTVKVKEDCEAIGMSVMRLVRDVGPCLKFDASQDCSSDNQVQMLYSAGPPDGWPQGPGYSDLLENQMTNNAAGYPASMWRGGYLSSAINADPWGTAYAVNIGYLAPQTGDDCEVNTFCLSAGPNRKYETPATGNGNGGVTRGGDDFVYVIGGPTCDPGCTGPNCNPGGGGSGTGHTIGYWKNHANAMPNPLDIWLGTGSGASVHVTSTTKAVSILTQHNIYGSPSNGIVKLYAQLLAAQLNILGGATPDAVTAAAIAQANVFLAVHPSTDWGTVDQAQVLAWQTILDNFNNSLDQVSY